MAVLIRGITLLHNWFHSLAGKPIVFGFLGTSATLPAAILWMYIFLIPIYPSFFRDKKFATCLNALLIMAIPKHSLEIRAQIIHSLPT